MPPLSVGLSRDGSDSGAISTPGDILFHIRAKRMDLCFGGADSPLTGMSQVQRAFPVLLSDGKHFLYLQTGRGSGRCVCFF
jgi:hypothetical protein